MNIAALMGSIGSYGFIWNFSVLFHYNTFIAVAVSLIWSVVKTMKQNHIKAVESVKIIQPSSTGNMKRKFKKSTRRPGIWDSFEKWNNKPSNRYTYISESISMLSFIFFVMPIGYHSDDIKWKKNDLQNPLSLQLIKKKNHLFRSDDKSDNDDQLRAKERSRPLSHLIFLPYDHNRGLPSQIVFIQDSVRKKQMFGFPKTLETK